MKSKASSPRKARDLYTSELFAKAGIIAQSEFDSWFVLSAKYGLTSPNTIIEPYEHTLNKMSKEERENWASDIFRELSKILNPGDSVTFFAGVKYRENLIDPILDLRCTVEIPMFGMSIGNQLKWLSFPGNYRQILKDIETFYHLIDILEQGLGGKRSVNELTGKSNVPQRGVYFFFEAAETRKFRPKKLRVTRVGTHAISRGSKSTLWKRLKTHIGTSNGGGNHRGSIFRLHVGNSLIEKKNERKNYESWSVGQSGTRDQITREKPIELLVSDNIGRMSMLWVEISDESSSTSDRAYIEKNSIGLLSLAIPAVDSPSQNWLGNHSVKECIRDSGLWNINHVHGGYDPEFLTTFETYVKATVGEIEQPTTSIAPANPKLRLISAPTFQLNLF